MKTTRPVSSAYAAPHQYRSGKSTTPLTSPKILAHSVGQAYPPRLSPKVSPGIAIGQEGTRSSSPGYFGLVVEPSSDSRESGAIPRDHWSSSSPSSKSFAAAIPKQHLPLDANPAYDAFRRQIDTNVSGRPFSLSTPLPGHRKASYTRPHQADSALASAALARPRSTTPITLTGHDATDIYVTATLNPLEWLHSNDTVLHAVQRSSTASTSASATKSATSQNMDVDGETGSLHDSAYVSSDSKRNSEASLNPALFPSLQRFESPSQLDSTPESSHVEDHVEPDRQVTRKAPRFPLSLGRLTFPGMRSAGAGIVPLRADTAPSFMDGGFEMMEPAQLRHVMDEAASGKSSMLLLDIRVSTYYSESRICGALNLCIPTTLLKRPACNLHKMQLTFAKSEDQDRFVTWRDVSHLVVYDTGSFEKRDVLAAANMLRKFTNEGYKGRACILRGGFKEFEATYPDYVDCKPTTPYSAGPASLSSGSSGKQRPFIAPILGGVMLPRGSDSPNPFFSNIRQNVDLADGVGRIDISLPASVDVSSLPQWLREATEPHNHGQRVSDQFLKIEQEEQARMRAAYASSNAPGPPTGVADAVQLSGIEKGGKNRYKDILPFEHSRVRLRGRPTGTCDYVNASHIHASRSNKRYIASQGPLPSTFDDFWSMIWDEDVRVIVMLTAESEGGQVKCHPYWTNKEYGPIRLQVLSDEKGPLDVDKYRSNSAILASGTSTTAQRDILATEFGRRRATTSISGDTGVQGTGIPRAALSLSSSLTHKEAPPVVIRKFALSHSDYPLSPTREVIQLHYASWPDFGAPAEPSDLLALVELANVMQRAVSPPNVPAVQSQTGLSAPSFNSPVSPSSAGAYGGSDRKSQLDELFWPWHDEPESNAHPRPMLVHCSAGCGRTGTFCAVDAVVDMLKRQNQRSVRRTNAAAAKFGRRASGIATDVHVNGEDVAMGDGGVDEAVDLAAGVDEPDKGFDPEWLDSNSVDLVARTVEDFRTQRLSMVQSLRQFVLCYETVTEWVARRQERRGDSGPGRPRSESVRMT